MEPHILERYERSEDGEFLIPIEVDSFTELYDTWDGSASYLKRDLNPDFTEYLFECARELGNRPLRIIIKCGKNDCALEEHVKKSIASFFDYLADIRRLDLHKHIFRISISAIIGLTFIILSTVLSMNMPDSSIFMYVLTEGLIIIGWVTMWQVVSGLIYEWLPKVSKIKTYKLLANTPLEFV